jgi:hypothetical protein
LPARAPEIAVPNMTGSRQAPDLHGEAHDTIDRASRSPLAEPVVRALSPATIITPVSDSPRRQVLAVILETAASGGLAPAFREAVAA